MARSTDFSFDAPIPGMSLTAEFAARPWQSPPEIASVDDAIEYYLERMSTDDFADQLTDVMEMGVPVADIANTLQLGAVMEGVHTIDVGILVMPLLSKIGATILKTLVFGTFITFCSLLQNLLAIFKSS